MYTSNFTRARNVSNTICISTGVPKWYIGPKYTDLNPGWSIVNEYKTNIKTLPAEEVQANYIKRYKTEVLDHLDVEKVYSDLEGKVMLCYESPGEFCHRRLVAEWIKEELDIDVPELIEFEKFTVGVNLNGYENEHHIVEALDNMFSCINKKITIRSIGADPTYLLNKYAAARGFLLEESSTCDAVIFFVRRNGSSKQRYEMRKRINALKKKTVLKIIYW